MDADGSRLGVDLGTSNTIAVLRRGDGRTRPLLFDGSPLLPSAVFADPVEGLLTGRDAVHAAAAAPERFEPYPKRRIDDGRVLLGDAEVAVVDLLTAVLRRVAAEACRVVGAPPTAVTLTCPQSWGPHRRGRLRAAADAAGLAGVNLVPEPVAAAAYFAAAKTVAPASVMVVYDLGAGTFDATVMRSTPDGFTILATHGLDDTGGLDIDAAIVADLAATCTARAPQAWPRLITPEQPSDRRASRLMWDNVRSAKEALSRLSTTMIHIPGVEAEAPLGRETLERLAAPVIERTIAATRAAIRQAGIDPDHPHGIEVYLVGGGSRLPLAATALHRDLRVAPTVLEQPELVVAEGSLDAPPYPDEDPTAETIPADEPPPPQPPATRSPVRPWRTAHTNRTRRGFVATLLLILAVTAAILAILRPWSPHGERGTLTTPPAQSPSNPPHSGPATHGTSPSPIVSRSSRQPNVPDAVLADQVASRFVDAWLNTAGVTTTLAEAAHDLISLACNVGATQLSQLNTDLLDRAGNRDLTAAAPLVAQIQSAAREVEDPARIRPSPVKPLVEHYSSRVSPPDSTTFAWTCLTPPRVGTE